MSILEKAAGSLIDLLEFKKSYILEALIKWALIEKDSNCIPNVLRSDIINLVNANPSQIKQNLIKRIKKSM